MSGYFEGRKLIVVGGSSGMGLQTARDIVGQGANAVIVGRQQAKVDQTVAELGKKGEAWGITADLADRKQVKTSRRSSPLTTPMRRCWSMRPDSSSPRNSSTTARRTTTRIWS